ncbi:molybdopterin-dependent oxidoreductase [Plantibacter flavus]|uniref:molybdopterin-dependent oxidoreductase n=1 Tax=Plantibacter flavus TaxID=150123 RepID=UPI003F1561B6
MEPRRRTLLAGAAGLVSAVATLGAAEAVAAFVAPAASPLLAVGSLVIDLVPGWVKDTVIALFGTNDKLVLLLVLGVLVAALAFGIGVLEERRPAVGAIALALVGGIAAFAALSRADAGFDWALPSVVGAAVGIIVLRALCSRLRTWEQEAAIDAARPVVGASRAALPRRSFLILLGGTAAGALVIGVGARVASAGAVAVETIRKALKLPAAAVAAPPIPAGADLGITGLSPLISPNDSFYRIDTALQVPNIDPSTWSLKIIGMVEQEVKIGFDELLALPLQESRITLTCVSNEVGGTLIGNALWLGYPIRELLKRAKPKPGADMVLSRSIDGFTAGTPLEVLQDEDRDCLLAVGMNGEPLPLQHGFPVRMVVPGLYGYVSATKWVVELDVTRYADASAYWTDRGWSELGPIKTQSRIDVPRNGGRVASGTVAVAGVAWAQHTGVARVQVRVDDGDWVDATLAPAISEDTWVQWVHEWDAAAGDHTIAVRATDATGKTQGETLVDVVPNGAEGWHTISVGVD